MYTFDPRDFDTKVLESIKIWGIAKPKRRLYPNVKLVGWLLGLVCAVSCCYDGLSPDLTTCQPPTMNEILKDTAADLSINQPVV